MNRVDAWGLESEDASSGDKPYYCRWSKCDDNGTLQGDYKPIEGDKDALPFLLDFSVPFGGKRYTILPSEIDPFREYYERNKK